MIAIPMREIQKLTFALPKCSICMPNEAGCSYIIDKEGTRLGDINWQVPRITIYEGYEYSQEVMEAIRPERSQQPLKQEVETDF